MFDFGHLEGEICRNKYMSTGFILFIHFLLDPIQNLSPSGRRYDYLYSFSLYD